MAKPIITLEDVWKVYPMGEVVVQALRGITLTINTGEFVAIIGTSGSGKSTLMNLVGCLDLPTQGVITLDGKDIARMRESELAQVRGKKIGFIFQQFHLITNLTALQNVMLPLEFQEMDGSEAEERATELLTLVGLHERMFHLPSQLSGGQQQRVAVARALANDPEVILADEPTGNLDSKAGAEVLSLLERLWHEEGKTIIMVTHDLKLARHAKRNVQIQDGKIIHGA